MEREDILQLKIKEYNQAIKSKASKKEEIEQLKKKIEQLEIEKSEIDITLANAENVAQAEIYKRYSKKDLLKMTDKIEKLAKKEVAIDFKNLVEKFGNHDLGMNDISQLQIYIDLYSNYVKKESGIIKGLFKALGGKMNG